VWSITEKDRKGRGGTVWVRMPCRGKEEAKFDKSVKYHCRQSNLLMILSTGVLIRIAFIWNHTEQQKKLWKTM
jgi:hypothetical protein